AAAVNGSAPKAGGRLSGGGISLRPGGGMGLRPGGGGISLTGGLNGQTLRPGGGGAVSLTGSVKESSGTAGYPKEEGKRSSANSGGKESDWRRDAAEHQDAKQKKASEKSGGKKGSNGKSGGRGRNNRDDDDDLDAEPIQLEVSDNSWAKIQQKRREEAEAAKSGSSDSTDEEIARRMKSILNKLTLEKFDDLYRQLTECGITKEDHIRILMQEVFEKATTQHHFVEMYTSLCVHFNDWCSEHLKVGKFKHVLLDQCQASFEANLSDPPKEMSPKKKAAATPEELEEHEEKRQRYRLRVMGNIRFIGQLLVKKMVASKILTACTTALLKEASQSSLEALASLLTITGKEFDLPTWQHLVCAPRRNMIRATSSASPQQCGTSSKSSPVVLVDVPESATSPSPSISMLSQVLSDSHEFRVHFEEKPEIILFLSADEDVPEELPGFTEEDERTNSDEINQPSSSTSVPPQTGETPLAAPGIPPAPHDLCQGGLADLAAERRAAMLRKLFPPQDPSEH
ncbi:EIF4G1, partial [Symbiodinium sp. KB8]